MSWLVFFSKLISPNFAALSKRSNSIQLVSIGFSHYCELASWCLKAKGLPYQEHAYVPLAHVFPALAIRVGNKSEKHLSCTSRTTAVADPNLTPEQVAALAAKEAKRDKASRSTAVPVAVCPDGKVWKDSWEIATKTGLTDIDPSLKSLLDEQVGPLARQLAYTYILLPRNDNIWNKLFTYQTGWLWGLLWWAFLNKFLKKTMIKTMRPYQPEAVSECRTKLEAALKQLDAIITNKKTPFLGGNSIGVADIAVASLMAPMVNPQMYCGGKYAHIFEQLMAQDNELKDEVDRVRATPAGAYVMQLYAKHR
jgi:glutathione S-transferase